jgi:RES domain-containing protein
VSLATAEVVRRRIRWRPCYRIIASRFPPIDLFARVADAADLDALHELESMTNDRLRDQSGEISQVPAADRAVGAGAAYVMAPFTHIAPGGGRFSTAQFGAYYAARVIDTAVAESAHHRERFMLATRQPAMELDMRVLAAELDARLHDVRGMSGTRRELYDREDYRATQAFATQLRASGSDGIVYDSVRHEGGQCVAVFRPKRLKNCRPLLHLTYVWDGARISDVYEKRPYGDS